MTISPIGDARGRSSGRGPSGLWREAAAAPTRDRADAVHGAVDDVAVEPPQERRDATADHG